MARNVVVRWSSCGLSLLVTAVAQQPATVCVIGVQHAPGQLLHAAMSPGHVRAALRAIGPDVVAVESCPEWFAAGRGYRATWEVFGIAVPWARQRRLPVYGVDWIGNEGADFAERQRRARLELERDRLAGATVDPRWYAYGACTAEQLHAAPGDPDCDFAVLNGDRFAQRWNDWLDGGRTQAGSAQEYVGRRNANIADRIAAAAKEHPGARIAVVIGAAHRGDLLRLLPPRGLKVTALPPLPDGDPDQWLEPVDLVALLTFASDNEQGLMPAPARRASLLARLRAAAVEGALVPLQRYVVARDAMLAGDLATAADAFAGLAEAGTGVRFPFCGEEWRLHLTVAQAALLELGRIADLRGERSAAVAWYRRLLATLPAPEFDADYHADFEFQARARNAVRALLDQPFTAGLSFRAPVQEAAMQRAAAAGRADLQRAWELHRARQWRELRTAVAAIDRRDLAPAETLELDFHLAAASVALGDREDARARLDALSKRAAGLPKEHWLVRELPALQR